MWGPPNDPQIYGALEIEATKLQHFLDTCKSHGHRVTPTHLVGRAIGLMLRDVPELNVRIVGERIVPRESVDVFFPGDASQSSPPSRADVISRA